MVSFNVLVKAGTGLVVAVFLGTGTPALAETTEPQGTPSQDTGMLDGIRHSIQKTVDNLKGQPDAAGYQVADASAKKNEDKKDPSAENGDGEKPKAGDNPLKEAFKKLVGKDDENSGEAEAAAKKDAATKKAENKVEPEKSGENGKEGEDKPKEGMIEKAFKKLVGKKEEEDKAKALAEEGKEQSEKVKAAKQEAAEETKKKEEERKEKTSETAKKFISDTIDKIVDTVKGDGKGKGEDDKVEEAKVDSKAVDKAEPEPEPESEPKSKSELELTQEEKAQAEETSQKGSNPLKDAFKKLVGKDKDEKEDTEKDAASKKTSK